MPLSAVDCVQPALQHTKQQLFTHFRWGQWSRLALVGILAAELHVGGCNFNRLNFPLHHPRRTEPGILSLSRLPFSWPPNPGQISEHIGQFAGLIVIGVFALIVFGFIFLYISSVFRFILFDSVLRRECSISEGWRKWRRAGGRFFLWQIVFQIAAGLLLLIFVGVPLALALAAGWATDLKQHVGRLILSVILLGGLFAVFVLAAAVVQVLAKDFLVPIMALDNLDFADGWHRLLAMIRPEKARFAVYLLLKIVLSIAAAILFGILALMPVLFVAVPTALVVLAGKAAGLGLTVTTISLAIIFGTVLLLLLIYLISLVSVPGTVFFPAYAMHFFASRYPKLDALLNPAPPPAPELPTVPAPPPPFEAPPLPSSPEPIG
ncbi:MAG: hypothetical protein WA718_03520 [Terriglobales bacterium]